VASVRVLGVRVDCLDAAAAVGRIEALADQGGAHLVATVNPEFVMRARADREFARVLESAALCLADGGGVVWAARRQGCRLSERVTGIDLLRPLCELCVRRGFGLFLLGAGPGVAEEAARTLTSQHPGLRVSTHAGTPRPADDEAVLRVIAAARPRVLLVAYGAPEQEHWIARNLPRLQVGVAIGVGGALDFVARRVPRAPAWMRRLGLEWLFRLLRQPWRLKRMAVLPVYAFEVMRDGR